LLFSGKFALPSAGDHPIIAARMLASTFSHGQAVQRHMFVFYSLMIAQGKALAGQGDDFVPWVWVRSLQYATGLLIAKSGLGWNHPRECKPVRRTGK